MTKAPARPKPPKVCPHCHQRSFTNPDRYLHCPAPGATCQWVKCTRCHARIDTTTGKHFHSDHAGQHVTEWECLRTPAGGEAT